MLLYLSYSYVQTKHSLICLSSGVFKLQDGCDATYSTRYGWPAAYAQFNGDGVADTPAHLSSSRDCSQNLNTCSDTTPGVDPGVSPMRGVTFHTSFK